MLPAAHRLRSSADFAAVTRHGRRARSGDVVVYLMANSRPDNRTMSAPTATARAGLIVSRKVGGSVVRHQVSRRLRAQLADRLDRLPPGSRLVVRALPSSAGADSARLGGALDAALDRLTRQENR